VDKPLTRWYCDVCHEPIDDPQHGYVIWKSEGPEYLDHSFKVIHQQRCDRKDHHQSKALAEFLGRDGLTYLLSHLSTGPLMGVKSGGVKDLDEYVDLIRRVQTPYYEEARRKFGTSELQAAAHGWNEYAPYTQQYLIDIINESKT
jgi:hypothetical protein